MSAQRQSILILEPNLELKTPYSLLDQQLFKLHFFSHPLAATEALNSNHFALTFLSCSFSSQKMLNFLEALKQASHEEIMPLVLVVDLSQPYSLIPGTNWSNKLGLLSSQSSSKELAACLTRLL